MQINQRVKIIMIDNLMRMDKGEQSSQDEHNEPK
jgi:hypothetical protein